MFDRFINKISFFALIWCFCFAGSSVNSLTQMPGEKPAGRIYSGNSPGSYINPDQYKIDIIHYLLNIDLNTEAKILKGDVTVTGVLKDKNLGSIDLNFYDNMKISELTLNGMPATYKEKGTSLSVTLNKTVRDTFSVRVVYEGTPQNLGYSSFSFGEINGHSCVYNLSEPDYASTWFPCNDIPSDKATYDINITNDSSMVSASNGKLISVRTEGGRRTYYWKTDYPTSTYLVCLYSSDYVNFSAEYVSLSKADTMPVEYYVFPRQLEEAKTDFREIPDMIRFFAGKFGEYPFIKEKYGVAEFLWPMGAMETQTLIGIGANFISGRQFFNDILVHELAHHWFGDAVGPETWKDIWLNEGFASYCEALYAESKNGPAALQSHMMDKFNENFRGTLYNPKDLFGSTVYDKGAWVLHMLRHYVGDSVFFSILRKYYNTYKYGSADTKDFENICEEVSGKDLGWFFDQWVYKGTGIIKLNYTWEAEKAGGAYRLNIKIDQVQEGWDVYKFPLDIDIKYENRTDTLKTFFIDKRQTKLEIAVPGKPVGIKPDPDNWLLASIPGE